MFLVIFRWKYYCWPIMGGCSIPNRPRGLRRHWGCSGISVGTSCVAGATHGARLPMIRTTNIILKNYKINENQRKLMKINENQWKSMKISENQWKSMRNCWFSLIFGDFQGAGSSPTAANDLASDTRCPDTCPSTPPSVVWDSWVVGDR